MFVGRNPWKSTKDLSVSTAVTKKGGDLFNKEE